ncbi:hypothetical protein MOBT1_002359 [Malassezia obtusa]|uniref:Protein YTP1-like C-terminal domain-containing protein n=1 Tax=Malassezia obtusa TaxID=76774 RepID=A0AAF0IX30_9BASI|nr:hypothetical protein MOBT1_002359 [Malassezia obtusa]
MGACALALALGVGTAYAAPALDARHGSEHMSHAPKVYEKAPAHKHDAAAPMPNVTAFCTVATHTNSTDKDCIALDAIDAFLDADTAGPALRPAPRIVKSGHHSHSGNTAPMEKFNETALFVRKGPVPLSYIEWDYGVGLGRLHELRRFASYQADRVAAQWPDRVVMGASSGYWRSLDDQDYPRGRTALREDVRARIGGDAGDVEPARYGALVVLTVVQFVLACFVLLPVVLCLQAVRSSLSPPLAAVYLALLTNALVLGRLYFALSPALYPPSALGGIARALFVLSAACMAPDLATCAARVVRVVHGVRTYAGSWHGLQDAVRVLLGLEERAAVSDVPPMPRSQSTSSTDRTLNSTPTDEVKEAQFMVFDAEDSHAALMSSPVTGEFRELDEAPSAGVWTRWQAAHPRVVAAVSLVHTVVSRGLVPLAFAVMYVALAVYTGACRRLYQNTCLAHGIKGGVFFWYGVLSFVRFLGAFGEYGWAWNKRPTLANTQPGAAAYWRRTMPSAEFVECFVIFLYGASNTWLERLGAEAGDPYTVKQVQHISIAVMFWFVGLVGMGLESVSLRTLIARAVVQMHPAAAAPGREAGDDVVAAQTPPPSYAGSFNPFPALVIGVTGVAMAAHHQDYVYEVQVHILWGEMLAAFALFRMLTYFLLWLRPPSSVLPSRPPTEILASFALTCGGLLFMLSNEEVSFAAMRADYGDFMAMLNVAVALVALVFSWSFVLMVIKAWALAREGAKASLVRPARRAWLGAL